MGVSTRILAFALVGAIVSGCAARESDSKFYPSGFLEDYEILQPGDDDGPRLVYRNPSVDIPAYEKILMDRVTIWRGADRVGEKEDGEDSVRIATMLYSAFLSALNVDHVMTSEPGPGVLRFRLALTDVGPESSELVVYSTVLPPPETFGGDREIDDETRTFLNAASVEAEVVDSETGELLIAAVGRRVGELAPDGTTDSWAELAKAFESWAARVSSRVRAARKD